MPIRRKPRPSPLESFSTVLAPDRIEEASARIDAYFDEHLHLSFSSLEGVSEVLTELIRDHGERMQHALEVLSCEEGGLSKLKIEPGEGDAKPALGPVVTALANRFGLAPAVALLLATLMRRAAACGGEKVICEALVVWRKKTTRHVRGIGSQKQSGRQRRGGGR